MKYFIVYDTYGKSLSNDAKSNNYYAAKSINDIIQKKQLKVNWYSLYNEDAIRWDNPKFDFEKDLPNIVFVSSGQTHISEIDV